MKAARLLSFSTIAILAIYFSTFSSCTKEYSCESCIVRDTTPPRDTIIVRDTAKIDSTLKFPLCSTCSITPAYVLNRWGFRNYQSLICGNTYYANIDSGYNVTVRAFQDCVKDTQFVITGRFTTQTFEADRTNVTASYSNFLLYAPNNVILAVAGGTNGTPLTMNMVLDTFNLSTGIASFRFFGYAYTNKGGSSYITGDSTYISDGRIRVKIK
jgi:hypothetical protein